MCLFRTPTGRLRHLPRAIEYLLSAALRRISSSISESHQQLGCIEHRQLLTTVPLSSESHCASRVRAAPAAAAGFLSTPSRPSSASTIEMCTLSSSEPPREFILCGNYISFPFKRASQRG